VPNNWSVDPAGKFTKDIETEQFKAAVGFVRDLYAAGVYYPDPNLNTGNLSANFVAGKYAITQTGWPAYGPQFWNPGLKLNPPVRFRVLHPFSADGSKPIWHQFQGMVGMTAVRKASADRVRELLRIMNFMAAPFGSQESLLLEYGVKDIDFSYDAQGNPVPNARGQSEVFPLFLQYIAVRMPVLYNPNDADFVKVAYADEQTMVPVLLADPTVGLYSPTETAKGPLLTQKVLDGLGDIVTGRSPLTALDQLVKGWRSGGGDEMRSDFQQAYAGKR
jgi:putative aldouronate transport system substrate-binding protein